MARDLLGYRDLLFLLIWREISVRYKQTAVGIVWVVLQPAASALIFAFVFGHLVRMPSEGLPYLVFAYSGTLIWQLFAQGVERASGSIVADEQLVRRVYFPRWIIPVASIGSAFIDFSISLLFLAAILIVYAIAPSWHLVLLVPAILLMLLLALAVGIATAALNAKYRDFRLVALFALQILQFVSPVFYSYEIVPSSYLGLLYLNPLAGPIELFRLGATGQGHFLASGFITSISVEMILVLICLRVFHALEDDLVDTI
jgi:lipopolysaccharide transport system permease protein